MKKVGYPQESIDLKEARVLVEENPHWESQAAFRHHEHTVAQDTELEANQSVPEVMEAALGTEEQPEQGEGMHFEIIGFREDTGHKKTT